MINDGPEEGSEPQHQDEEELYLKFFQTKSSRLAIFKIFILLFLKWRNNIEVTVLMRSRLISMSVT